MPIRSFVRRARPLSKSKQTLLKEFLPKVEIKLVEINNLVKSYDLVNLEIGFGKGDFLVKLALDEMNNTLNIGCEPYIEGVVNVLKRIKEYNIENIRLWSDDALLLLPKLDASSIDNIYILFPDPWSKKRQHKRRLINAEVINLLYDKLKSKGKIFIATDHHEYAEYIYKNFKDSRKFVCEDITKSAEEFFKDAATTYHKKNIEGKEIKLFKIYNINPKSE